MAGKKLIRVIRDAGDVTFSPIMNQRRKHGDAVLGADHCDLSQPAMAAAFWNLVNATASELGEEYLSWRYPVVCFEELCRSPREMVERIAAFLGRPASSVALSLVSEIRTPVSTGAWRTLDTAVIAEIERFAADGLRRFGCVA